MIESLDQSVGKVMATLKELDLITNTVVIFVSDNGGLSVREGPNTPATSNFPLRAGKGYLYEGGVRVPLILSGYGSNGLVVNDPVHVLDLFPTVLQLAKAKREQHLDGTSLVSALLGETNEVRPIFTHYPHYSNQGGQPGAAIRLASTSLSDFLKMNALNSITFTLIHRKPLISRTNFPKKPWS
jgi:arylsulfatase A